MSENSSAAKVVPVQAAKVDPRQLTKISPWLIKADPAKNYGRWLADRQQNGTPTPDQVSLALHMAKNGSLEPVKVLRIAKTGEQFDLVSGFNRHRAAMMIVEGFNYVETKSGFRYCEPGTPGAINCQNTDFKLSVVEFKGNEQDRIKACMGENSQRKDLTPMDKAHMVRQLIQINGLSQSEVAAILRIDKSYISQLEKLLTLPRNIQDLLASGDCQVGARTLMKITELETEDERNLFLTRILEGEKITLEQVRDYIINRDDIIASEGEEEEGSDEGEEEEGSGEDTSGEGTSSTGGGGSGKKKQQVSNAMLRKFYGSLNSPGKFAPVANFAKFMADPDNGRLVGCKTDSHHATALDNLCRNSAQILFDYLAENGLLAEEVPSFKEVWATVKRANLVAKPEK